MKKTIIGIVILGFLGIVLGSLEAAPPKGSVGTKAKGKKTLSKKTSVKVKKKQFVDLEGLEVQGLIDRPQTLYILKKSDTAFKDNIDEYDYLKAIVDSTYNEPF